VQCQGGLGNQLFQLSLALYLSQEKRTELDFVIKDSKDEMKIQNGLDTFVLPSNISVNSYRNTKFFKIRALNLATRLSTYSSTSSKGKFFIFIKRTIIFVYNLFNYEKRKLFINEGIGYSIVMNSDPKPIKFIGYFQSHRWAEIPKIRKQLMNLELKQKSKWVEQYVGYSQEETPLVVHLRLGDYLDEAKIGIPTIEYYRNGIDMLWSQGIFTTIWIFTNDETEARSMVGDIKGKKIRWITDNQDNAAHNLEVMRLGHGYVISNSTFSWWGAFLSRNPNSPVVAPRKWFIGMEDPLDLCPSGWIRI
jgi:hypothetical protein